MTWGTAKDGYILCIEFYSATIRAVIPQEGDFRGIGDADCAFAHAFLRSETLGKVLWREKSNGETVDVVDIG